MNDQDPAQDPALVRKLRDGLDRIATAMKSEQWSTAEPLGLNPAQAGILQVLVSRQPDGLRIKDIARHVGVSQPSATDSVSALSRKGLVEKMPDPDDARATRVKPTDAGMKAASRTPTSTPVEHALASLGDESLETLLTLTIRIIRALQIAGAIAPQRLCVTCAHFRPHAHPDPSAPHHCGFVDAPLADRMLRLDCGDHETADQPLQTQNWTLFLGSTAAIQPNR